MPIGGTPTFSITASGSAPLSYFWQRNGIFIDSANAENYVTNNVQLADSGTQFSCLVSNALGVAVSSNALLNIDPNLIAISAVALNISQQIQFQIAGQSGDVYRVQASTNLPNDWQTIASVTNVSGIGYFTDVTATNLNRRFYRAVLP